MMIHLFRRAEPTRTRRTRVMRHSLVLEGLEERTVMSAAAAAHIAVMPAAHVAPAAHATTATLNVPIHVTGATITKVAQIAAGQLQATGTLVGTIAGHAFSTPLTLTQHASTTSPSVPVLHLMLGPIHLNLLGLKVDTSEICLNVDAQPGPGNLLGNLVGDVANLLNGSIPTTPAGLTSLVKNLTTELNKVGTTTTGTTSSVLGLLNTGLGSALNHLGSPAVTGTTPGATNILTLSVGPLHLNLLGLVVNLDNCAGGPVTVAVTAQRGAGNLLGNLLSGLSNLLNNPGNPVGGITAHLNQILGVVQRARPVA